MFYYWDDLQQKFTGKNSLSVTDPQNKIRNVTAEELKGAQ